VLWHRHTSGLIDALERSGLASFEMARERLAATLWPETLRLFSDVAERLQRLAPVAMLQRTLQAGVFDEYGLPAFEEVSNQTGIKVEFEHYHMRGLYLTFPKIILVDKVHAYVIDSDGKVNKHELRLPKSSELTRMLALANDLLVAYRDAKYQGHFYWASNSAQLYGAGGYFYSGGDTNAMATVVKDGSVFLGQQLVRPGEKQMPQPHDYLHDGERFWRVGQEYDQQTGNRPWKIREVDPQTGKTVRESVPPWFEETEGGTLELGQAELMPAPVGAESSPLGTTNGMVGWKTIQRREGSYFGVGIDGRRWDKPLVRLDGSLAAPVALLRQAGTDAFLPVTTTSGRSGSYWIWDVSGTTVVASLQDFHQDYAAGQVTVLPLHFWHLLQVRDEASSRKLRGLDQEVCAALLQAAAADREQTHAACPGRSDIAPQNPLWHLLPVVTKLLPTAPERMTLGVARVIERAEQAGAEFLALRDRTAAAATRETTAVIVAHRQADRAAAPWRLPPFRNYAHESPVSIREHLTAAVAFLKGNAEPGELPRTNYLWFPMLENLGLRCWQTYWRVLAAKMTQKEDGEVSWLEFLKLWLDLDIAELPGQLALMQGYPKGAKKNNWGGYEAKVHGGASSALQNGEDRPVIVENELYHNQELPYHILRYSTAKAPGAPPGYVAVNAHEIKHREDPAQIASFMAAVESGGPLPLPSREELAEVAGKLAVSPAEIGLVWMGGLKVDSAEHNFLPAELRTALGWKAIEASAGRQALRNLNPAHLSRLYEAVVSQGWAAPFAADRQPVLRALEETWKASLPRRLPLEAALQTRLSALGKAWRWQRLNYDELLVAAADPAKHPALQPRPIAIELNKEQNYHRLDLVARNKGEQTLAGNFLRSLVHLIALVHAETAAGHPARSAIPALIKQLTHLLNHESTLFHLRFFYLYEAGQKKPLQPSEWLLKRLGPTTANATDGTVRYDDALIAAAGLDSSRQVLVAFRPAGLQDESDLARLRGIQATEGETEYVDRDNLLALVAAIKSPGFQKLAVAIRLKEVPEGQWPQNPSYTAPNVVKAIRKKHKLDEEPAVLYAQVLALPDPTTANVCAWNGWTAAQLKQASAELASSELVLEAVRARAGRSIFLPGEWAEVKAPWLPIESWKYAHLHELGLKVNEPCPAAGPLVLRPFGDLFAAAWQRVLDGDAPRYEEVKRKKKK
jgi:hypothetical protein